MRPNSRTFPLLALAAAGIFPATAAAVPLDSHESSGYRPALVCGMDYSKNSVSGNYCTRTAAPSAPVSTPTNAPKAAPTRIVVHDSGFAWGDAAAGAGAAAGVLLLGAGAITAARRRRPSTPAPRRAPVAG
jgi:hypothetical protein